MRRILIALPALLTLGAGPAPADTPADPERVIVLEPITVTGQRLRFGSSVVVAGREDLNLAIERLGFVTVRRGVPLGADLYVDGYKRSDITVTVDGERYHNACPNRMDPPTSLALPVEVESMSWAGNAASPGSGIAGELAVRRLPPRGDYRVRGGVSGNTVSGGDYTSSLALEGRGQRLSGRYAAGRSYRDGAGKGFGDRYGYTAADVRYSQWDAAYRLAAGAFEGGVQYSTTRDVPYPYLLMDERENELANLSLGLAGQRLYVNRTRHVMDAGLRSGPTPMRTDAEQWTVGFSGRALGLSLEAYHRQWDADNTIGAGMMRVQNHLIPGYRQWTANVARRWTGGATSLDARLGLTAAGIGDATVMPTYRILHADAAESRTFIPFGVALNYMRALGGGVDGGVVGEVVSEPPTAEQLYVVVRRPSMPGMRRPDWIGDPTLAQPVRLGARGVVRIPSAQVEVHASHIAGYVLPEARRVGMRPYQTFANVDAALAGLRARGRLSRLEWEAAYTAGWNLTQDVALAEVAPLTATAAWRQPLPARLEGTLRVAGATAQPRVDPNLLESSTAAWARLDAGLFWQGPGGLRASFEVDNLTDALYHQHLSYFRDPFASGARVTEPGRTLRVGVSMDL